MNSKPQTLVAFMKFNLHRRLMLDELARSVNLSPSRICCLFKSQTGMPPMQYLKAIRMQKARELLETTSLSIKEITAKVGLRDESHFVRDFKKFYGLTPSQYREERLAADALARAASGTRQ